MDMYRYVQLVMSSWEVEGSLEVMVTKAMAVVSMEVGAKG